MEIDVVENIKQALLQVSDVEFSGVAETRDKIVVKVNSTNPAKARALLCSFAFSENIGYPVVPLRKTVQTGFSVQVQYPRKPVYIRIRRGGIFMRGMQNEACLTTTLDAAIGEGVNTVQFKGSNGKSIVIRNVVSARRVGSDVGSRMGNRADIEIMDAKGVAHRFSVKKENASGVAGLVKFFKKRRLSIQRKLRTFLADNPNMEIHPRGYVSVPVMNETLFRYCWFGNDIDKNGGVLVGDFDRESSFSLNKTGDAIIINCSCVFSPKNNIDDLMSDYATGIDLLMQVNRRTLHLDIIGAKFKKFAARYEIPGFDIDEVTSESTMELLD